MKKKIINGILMAAVVAATSTSFVSCKDTSEDVKTDLMAQVNAVKANLEPRVEQAEKDIDALEDSVSTHRTELNGLRADVNDLKTRVGNLEKDVDSLEDVTKKLEYRMDTVENRIATIVDALRKMVTSHKTIDRLTDLRIRQNREFFNVAPQIALDIFRDIATTIDDAEVTLYVDNKPIEENERKESQKREVKRPRFKFSMCGIKIGEQVTFDPTGIVVKVASDDSIEYEGRIYKLSPFAGTFMPEDKRTPSGAYQGAKYFSYYGKVLDEIRKEKESHIPFLSFS